ncbi:MAG: dTDP-4-dehydrorhamnose reductase [Bacteroidaceae bacterium]
MRRILITGANGQLGNELQVIAKEITNNVYYFTDVDTLDICDEQAVLDYVTKHEIDVIVNCAAYTAVDRAEENVELCDKLNHLAPGYLAKAIQTRGGAMIQISTDYVFDGTNHIPYKEDEPTCPISVYGITKLAGEANVQSLCKQSIIIRTAWLYSTFGKNFVKTMMNLGWEKPTIGVVFDQVGTPTYARDLARAIYIIIGKGIIPGIYHFSNEGVCSWYDFTKSIHRLAGIGGCKLSPLHTEDFPTAATRPHYSVLDKTKIKETYGIDIPHWEESLRACITLLTD